MLVFLCLRFREGADLAVVALGVPEQIRLPQPTLKPAIELVFLCLRFREGADLAVVALGAPGLAVRINPAPATNKLASHRAGFLCLRFREGVDLAVVALGVPGLAVRN